MQKPGVFLGHISKTFLLSTCKMEKKYWILLKEEEFTK